MRRTVIYIPELGKSFWSVSAAAAAAGADPSNVGKVLRGQRKSAGGFHFEYRWAKEAGRGDAIKAAQAAIKEANRIIFEEKEHKRFGFSSELQNLDKFRDLIGSTKKGRIKSSTKTFETYSVGEIELITQKVQQRIFLAKKALKKMDEEIKDLASMLGLSFNEALEYDIVFPEFYRMLQLAAKDQRIGTNEMLEVEQELTQAGASEIQMQTLFNKLDRFFADPAIERSYFDEAVAEVKRGILEEKLKKEGRAIPKKDISEAFEEEFGNEDLF